MTIKYNARIASKRDTSANWTESDPVILYGEIIVVDTASGEVRFKIGDGVKRYTQLPFQDEYVRSLFSDAVKITAQELTEEQQSQILTNLGIDVVFGDQITFSEVKEIWDETEEEFLNA